MCACSAIHIMALAAACDWPWELRRQNWGLRECFCDVQMMHTLLHCSHGRPDNKICDSVLFLMPRGARNCPICSLLRGATADLPAAVSQCRNKNRCQALSFIGWHLACVDGNGAESRNFSADITKPVFTCCWPSLARLTCNMGWRGGTITIADYVLVGIE